MRKGRTGLHRLDINFNARRSRLLSLTSRLVILRATAPETRESLSDAGHLQMLLWVLSSVFTAQSEEGKKSRVAGRVVESCDVLFVNLSAHADVRLELSGPQDEGLHFRLIAEQISLSTFRARVSAPQSDGLRHQDTRLHLPESPPWTPRRHALALGRPLILLDINSIDDSRPSLTTLHQTLVDDYKGGPTDVGQL